MLNIGVCNDCEENIQLSNGIALAAEKPGVEANHRLSIHGKRYGVKTYNHLSV